MSAITAKLPRECTGQEVLDAFRAAATFQETPTRKWEAHGYTPPTGMATAENTFSQERGYYATPAYLREQGSVSRLFLGRRDPTWHTVPGMDISRFHTQIRLHALQPEKKYVEVGLTMTYQAPCDNDIYALYAEVIHDPSHEKFSHFRPAYDRIVKDFLQRLQHA